jgi:hypothetical protein
MLSEVLAVGRDQSANELALVSKSFRQGLRHPMKASLAEEEARLPRCVMKSEAGDLPAAPWKFNRCERRLVFDEGTWKALLQNLGRGTCLLTALGRFLNEKALQSFFDNGFLIRELAVLDLVSNQSLKIVCESDFNHQ